MTTINQVIVGAAAADAITSMAREMEPALRGLGATTIYARYQDPSAEKPVGRIDEMPLGRSSDVLIYHASFGDPYVTQFLLSRPERLVLVYHNITPSRYYMDIDPAFAAGLEWGRHELRLLRDRTVLSIAVSKYNAGELADLGYRNTVTVPIGLRVDRLVAHLDDVPTLDELRRRVPDRYVVNVSQLLPHKRQDVLVQAIHILQSCRDRAVGLVLVGTPRSRSYERALGELARRLRVRSVWFAHGLSDPALATVVRHAGVFATASEHEGLGVPPLEAMALDVPTVGRDAGAVRETLEDAGLVLPPDAGPLLFAAAIERVLDSGLLRSTLIERGRRRAAHFSEATRATVWLPYIERLVSS